MEKQNIILPTNSRMKLLKGVAVNKRSEVLNYAAELTSNLAEVIAPAFGPNGLAVLFTRECSSSANSTGMSPVISRTGLQMVEILVLRNSTKSVHPLLKSLVDSCRVLELEWGDGVKSLVLITSELLRQCSMLECVGRPGCLRKELGKALDFLSKCCQFPDSSHPYQSILPADSKQCQEKHSHSSDEECSVNTMNAEKLISNSQFIYNHYLAVLDLLKMFFHTRFPSHVVDVVPNLLCDWVIGMEKNSIDLNFMVDNFSSLCHLNVGFPMDHCSVLDGVMVQGSGVGCLFASKSDNFHKETCSYSFRGCDINREKSQSDKDGCHGCVSINVEIITEHEVSSAFVCGHDQFQFKTNYLYLTSCIPSDVIKFKICQLDSVSLIHSIPIDDVDFLRCLIQDQKSSRSTIVDHFFVNWVRRWPASPSGNSGLIWLGVPCIRSLILSVPVMGMKDGLKRSCHNALSLIRQFSFHSRHRCTEKIKQSPPKSAQISSSSSKGEHSKYPLNGSNGQISMQKGTLPTYSVNILPVNPTFCFEKLLSDHVTSLENVVTAGGLAEIYLHDMVIAWWMTPPHGGGEYIDREVTKAIALALLVVPTSLSKKGKLIRNPCQPLTLNFSSKSKELIAHRLRIVQLAVSVAFSLSNISDVMLISKSTTKMNIISSQNLSESDDDDD